MTDKNLEEFLDKQFVAKTKIFKKYKYIFFLNVAELYNINQNRKKINLLLMN